MSLQVKGSRPSDLYGQPYEIKEFQGDSALAVSEGTSAGYSEVMSLWEDKSGLRTQFRFPASGEKPGKLPWSHKLVPMAEDLRFHERWETVGTPLLQQHHDRFQKTSPTTES